MFLVIQFLQILVFFQGERGFLSGKSTELNSLGIFLVVTLPFFRVMPRTLIPNSFFLPVIFVKGRVQIPFPGRTAENKYKKCPKHIPKLLQTCQKLVIFQCFHPALEGQAGEGNFVLFLIFRGFLSGQVLRPCARKDNSQLLGLWMSTLSS